MYPSVAGARIHRELGFFLLPTFNLESIRRLWCSPLDMYTSTCLDVVEVDLSSEVPESCALIGVLAQDVTLWGRVSEKH